MAREMKLDRGEITVLKTLGLSGESLIGKTLIERSGGMETAEFLDTIKGLLDLGYVVTNKVNVQSLEEAERALFRVNQTYAHELKAALNPGRSREQTGERRRRRV
jgi:hypothetical protein